MYVCMYCAGTHARTHARTHGPLLQVMYVYMYVCTSIYNMYKYSVPAGRQDRKKEAAQDYP